jgi:hypothetical protein
MNIEISPVADLALRKQIERAVGPVRARRARKLVMREELLAHLTAIYSEERKREPDEQAAVTRALTRFGQPAALTAELNASVGLAERIAYRCDWAVEARATTSVCAGELTRRFKARKLPRSASGRCRVRGKD